MPTELPQDYDECVQLGGHVQDTVTGHTYCAVKWSKDGQPELFEVCFDVPGLVTFVDDFSDAGPPSGPIACTIHYFEHGCPCFEAPLVCDQEAD